MACLDRFPLLISNNYSCKRPFFQWKFCPQLCQQDFWVDYCSPGKRQEALSLLKAWAPAVAARAKGASPITGCRADLSGLTAEESEALRRKATHPSDLTKAMYGAGSTVPHHHLGQVLRNLILSLSSSQRDCGVGRYEPQFLWPAMGWPFKSLIQC